MVFRCGRICVAPQTLRHLDEIGVRSEGRIYADGILARIEAALEHFEAAQVSLFPRAGNNCSGALSPSFACGIRSPIEPASHRVFDRVDRLVSPLRNRAPDCNGPSRPCVSGRQSAKWTADSPTIV